ncbi:hypothetical protein [Bacillus sp. KbaB1]|uniref:hypothetical protein n=1 Tax=Bacillus sp. KbaB1 TaxID=1972845 RepID=UPI000B7F9BF5|nr:hypothetical protein [Bacillus sp. KbaB1]OXL97084.1 hypothetical protein B6N65_17505 [Bacillus sp. KbaB1]
MNQPIVRFSIQIGEETFSFMKLKEIEETHRKHMESFFTSFQQSLLEETTTHLLSEAFPIVRDKLKVSTKKESSSSIG